MLTIFPASTDSAENQGMKLVGMSKGRCNFLKTQSTAFR
jgi:hypothetical protein